MQLDRPTSKPISCSRRRHSPNSEPIKPWEQQSAVLPESAISVCLQLHFAEKKFLTESDLTETSLAECTEDFKSLSYNLLAFFSYPYAVLKESQTVAGKAHPTWCVSVGTWISSRKSTPTAAPRSFSQRAQSLVPVVRQTHGTSLPTTASKRRTILVETPLWKLTRPAAAFTQLRQNPVASSVACHFSPPPEEES